jgi:hypothetical protein
VPNSPLSAEVRDLIRRIVEHPIGFQLLCRGNLDSVSVLLGVHPFVLGKTRDMLHDSAQRPLITQAILEARERFREEGPTAKSVRPSPPAHEPLRTAEELIRAVGDDATGADLLFHAPPETVAILFCIHPSIVLEARDVLRTRHGYVSSLDEDTSSAPD